MSNQVNCPYKKCKLKCTSIIVHRARYAYITNNSSEKVLDKPKTSKVNWEILGKLGIISDLTQESDR